MYFDVDFDDAAAQRTLDGIGDRLTSPLLVAVLGREQLTSYADEVFATSGFGQWAPIEAATAAAKGSGRVLVDTGQLLADVTSPGSVSVSGDTAILATDVAYAGYLKRGVRGAPSRDPLPEPDSGHVSEWARETLRWVTGGLA